MGRVWICALLGLVACSDQRWLAPPFEAPVAYLYTGPDSSRWLAAETDLPEPLEVDREAPLYALEYRRPLEELQLAPGPVPITSLTPEGRALPLPVALVRGLLEIDGGWEPADLEVLAGLAVPTFDAAGCLERGQCVDAEPSCIPCPARQGPEPPELPRLACPLGWVSELGPAGLPLCEPNEPPALPCGEGEVQAVGEPGCEALAPCSAGEWPARRSALPPLYLRSGASNGDGSEALPFGSFAEAWATTDQPREILFAAGEYSEALRLSRAGWILNGRCPSQVTLHNDAGPTVVVTASVTIVGLSISGVEPLRVQPAGELHLAQVRVLPGAGDGISVLGRLQARRLWVKGRGGDGLVIEPGAVVELEDGHLEDSAKNQLLCRGGRVKAVGLRVSAQQSGPSCETFGVTALSGGEVELSRVVVEGFCKTSLRSLDPGTRLSIEDGVVRDNRPSLPSEGAGLSVFGGASARLFRVAFQRVLKDAVQLVEGQLRAEDLLVEDTIASDPYSYGIFVGEQAELGLSRGVLRSNDISDLIAVSTSSVTLEDVVVLPGGSGAYARVATDQLVARRLYLGAAPLTHLSGQGRLELSDLTLESGDLETGYFPTAQVTRVRAGGGAEYGLRITPRGCGVDCRPMVISDLLFEDLQDEAIGIEVESVLATQLRRFEVRGGAYGLRVRDGLLQVNDGLINGAKTGVWAPSPPKELERVFGGIELIGVETKVLYLPID